MTDLLAFNEETILCEVFDLADLAPDLISAEEERYWQEIADCGKPITVLDKSTGELVEHPNRRCKHFKDCEKCSRYKKWQEGEVLKPLIGQVRYVEVSKKDEKKLTRKYGSKNIRRIPIGDNLSAFVIKTDDNIGELFTDKQCQKMIDNSIPTDNRRISGKLNARPKGIVTDNCDRPEEDEARMLVPDENYSNDNIIECHYREMSIKYDSEDASAPQNVKTLNELMQKEVEIYANPDTEEKLQDAVYLCEQKVQEICERYEMSFYFFIKKIGYALKDKVDWKWTKDKCPSG